MNAATQTEAPSRHPFARAGYVAPYTLKGAVSEYYDPLKGSMFNDGSARRPCGMCDVCGTCFGDGATWEDAKGRTFKTGLVCAEKAHVDYDDPKMVAALREYRRQLRRELAAQKREASREKRAVERKERRAREDAERDAYVQIIDREVLAKIAHPVEWRADRGQTMADYLAWCEENGKLRYNLDKITEALEAYKVGAHEPAVAVPSIENSEHVGGFETYKRGAKAGQPKLDKKGAPKWARERGVEVYRIGLFELYDYGFGAQWIVKFVTRDGNVLAWKTSYPFDVTSAENKRDWVRVDFTPKSHETDKYNEDRSVTWVTRVNPAK
jgi:hypothetical protein